MCSRRFRLVLINRWRGEAGQGLQWVGWQWAVNLAVVLSFNTPEVLPLITIITICLSETLFTRLRQPSSSAPWCQVLPNVFTGEFFYFIDKIVGYLSNNSLGYRWSAVSGINLAVHYLTSWLINRRMGPLDPQLRKTMFFAAMEASICALMYNVADFSGAQVVERAGISDNSFCEIIKSIFIFLFTAFASASVNSLQHCMQQEAGRDASQLAGPLQQEVGCDASPLASP